MGRVHVHDHEPRLVLGEDVDAEQLPERIAEGWRFARRRFRQRGGARIDC